MNASFTVSANPTVDMPVVFMATVLGGASVYNLKWDFGDGTVTRTTNLTVSHIYTMPGRYTVVLTVTGPA